MKNGGLVTIIIIVMSLSLYSPKIVGADIKGDINADGTVNLNDTITGLKLLSNTEPVAINKETDINGDGKIGLQEIIYTLLPCSHGVTLGWQGDLVIPNDGFLNASNWVLNQADSDQGDKIAVTSNGSDLQLDWNLGTGDRGKWVQCYMRLPQPLSLENVDIFGLDLKGADIDITSDGNIGFELKFEDGSWPHAVMKWEGIKGMNRWYEKLVAVKKQFENTDSVDWSNITTISLGVYSTTNSATGSGTVNVKNLVQSLTRDWPVAKCREIIEIEKYGQIKDNAISAITDRQTSIGLLTTWVEEDSSWLYGQGLALKALVLEGEWNGTTPRNEAAQAAENLAVFLANNLVDHERGGYWPRAWKSSTGEIIQEKEADGTIWMGDFPWPLIGLQCYYKKTEDERVKSAIEKALWFIKSLIDDDGKLFTLKVDENIEVEVTSCEAGAAVLQALYESDETQPAEKLWNYLYNIGWDNNLNYWKEAKESYRPVLFANTWLSPFLMKKGLMQEALHSLTFIGKVLYTRGPGEPWGLDGIGPIAVWYEGTLSYISAGGPHSLELFNNLRNYINSDGTVNHYNDHYEDNISVAGIWASTWHSLDGTSWLYFVASGTSPFDTCDGMPYQP